MSINPENYIVIQGFMITELGLKGNELLTFALIYGFTQDGETEFSGSIGYICEWLGCTKPTASATLKSLTEKGLIQKRSEIINGVTFNHYKISLGGVKKFYGGGKEILWGGGKKTLPNKYNIDNTRDKDIKEKYKKESDLRHDFEMIWSEYPRKHGKDTAFNAYKKAIEKGTTNEAILNGVRKYAEYIRINKIEQQFIKHGSTWFNQHCWDDEYVIDENRNGGYQQPDESAYDLKLW